MCIRDLGSQFLSTRRSQLLTEFKVLSSFVSYLQQHLCTFHQKPGSWRKILLNSKLALLPVMHITELLYLLNSNISEILILLKLNN
jgi:hypothetical protein